jgi:predicted transcriptional regulator
MNASLKLIQSVIIYKHTQVSVSQIAKATNLSTESAQKIITFMINRSTFFMM